MAVGDSAEDGVPEVSGQYRWWTIVIATAFNLLFEYSVRGFGHLLERPLLPLVLTPLYFAYFVLLEDLVVRWRLRDAHVLVAGVVVGTIIVPLASGACLLPPLTLGVNWGALFFIDLIWWGPLQFVMALYIANRLAPRDWHHARLGPIGWTGFALLFAAALTVIHTAKPVAPPETLQGWITIGILLALGALVFGRLLPGRDSRLPLRVIGTLSVAVAGTILLLGAALTALPLSRATGVGLLDSRTVGALATILCALLLAGILFRWLARGAEPSPAPRGFAPDPLMNVLSLLTCGVFFVCGAFLDEDPVPGVGYRLNATAIAVVTYWTSGLAVVMLVARLLRRRAIPV